MFKHDYTKTMMMKLFMSRPDGKGGTVTECDFDRADDILRQADALTLGAPKILYLVGWQYNGHDDRYPSFFEVNPALKSPGDATAPESMLRFINKAAEQYNTVVSVHINFSDAYENSPLFEEYRSAGALIRNSKGEPAAIEEYNGQPCYKISYKEEWESGLFQRRVDKLLELLPLREAGTIHADNFQCFVNRKPSVSIKTMQAYRKKMIDYLAEKGIDVTSEFSYREGPLTRVGYGALVRDLLWRLYPLNTLGQVPAVWWADKLKRREVFEIYPEKYACGLLKGEYGKFLYGNIHGEDLWLKNNAGDGWQKEFLRQFAAINVPYFYLASLKKEKLSGRGKKMRMVYTNGTVSYLREQKIANNGVLMKAEENLLLPLAFKEDACLAYSKNGYKRLWQMPVFKYNRALIYDITPEGPKFLEEKPVVLGRIELDVKPGQALLLELKP